MTDEPKIGLNTGNAGKGRPKGAVNKMTRTIKAAIEEAFVKVGGAEYLAEMAVKQPAAFMTLLGKVLPTQMEHSNPDGSMSTPTRIVIEPATSIIAAPAPAILAASSDPE